MSAPRCRWCGQSFVKVRHDQSCCSAEHNQKIENLEAARAKTVYRALYDWRNRRGTQAATDGLRFVCRSIAAWKEEDQASQRPAPPRHRHDLDRGYIRHPMPTFKPKGGDRDGRVAARD